MKKSIFFISLFLFSLVGCEKKRSENNSNTIEKPIEYEHTVWINPDVECCGVKDPLNNLEWLKETSKFDEYKDAPASDYNFIFLFRNKETKKDHIVVNRYNRFSWVLIYNCEGVLIDGGSYSIQKQAQFIKNNVENDPPEPCDTCDTFFQTHILVDTIAYSMVKS